MSTEHQQYSTENQHAAIQRYADEHGLLIVRTFTDAGKSGVGIHGRDALQELLRIVNSGAADFATILVYDVSRWGRFQDADEAAHYEFQCKRRKITVQYCAEHFPNDASPMSAVIKSRVSFDLIGPPTPAEVDEFLADGRADAYPRQVDRLLASPHYGERWGRHWLDLARYADSHGSSGDGPREIWK